MGLKTLSSLCQRLINIILRGAHRYAGSLQDNILVFSTTFPDHLTHMRSVLDRLRRARLMVNAKRMFLRSGRTKILGHLVINRQIYPDEDKVKAITSWPTLRTKKTLKSFLGLVSHFRDHIYHYTEIAFLLTRLLGQNSPNKLLWGPQQEYAFQTLRTALTQKPVCNLPTRQNHTRCSVIAHNIP